MNQKWLRFSFVVLITLVMGLAFIPAKTAHAGFVNNEEPARSTVSYAPTSGRSAFFGGSGSATNTAFHRRSVFPMVGRYVIYPGRAFKLQFFYDLGTCFCEDKHHCVDYQGEKCYP